MLCKLIKRMAFAIMYSVGMFLISMLVTVPLTYGMNFLMPFEDLINATNVEMVVYAARLSAILMVPPLILYCHSMLPDHAKLETDVVLKTFSDLLNDGIFLLLVGSIIFSCYFL
jgi:FAD/FMN-containing dehydrogenase